jgi:hypothetical protein
MHAFGFTIRELVLLTAILGMGVAWALDHRRQEAQAARESELHQKELAELEARIHMLKSILRTIQPDWEARYTSR